MTDSQTQEMRSKNMSAIRASNNAPEREIRKILFSEGFRYRLNQKKLPGKPDIVLAKYKTIVFIHGCFWHRHTCHLASMPKTNIIFWLEKFASNVNRDQRNINSLSELGWKIIIIWECAIKGKYKLTKNALGLKLISTIQSDIHELIEIEGHKDGSC